MSGSGVPAELVAADVDPEGEIRLLLVEDSADEAEFVLRTLRNDGLRVAAERVCTLDDLERALGDARWDLVLCDHRLPGFTGPQAIRLVKARLPDLPVILVSGTVGEDKAVDAMRAGAHDYVLKHDLTRLAPAVRRELRDAVLRQERTRMERELHAARERQEHILTSLPLVLFSSVGSRLTWISENCERVTGFAPSAFLEDPDSWRNRLRPEDRRRLAELSGGDPTPESLALDFQWQHANEEWRWYMLQAQVRPRPEGPQVHGLVLDISDRRSLQQQLQQAQKMEALGRLAGGVAHDFNNLLTAIRGYTEAMMTRLPVGGPGQEDLVEVLHAAERAAALTRRLLTFSRHQPPQETGPTDVNEVVRQVERMLRPIIGEDVQVELRLADGPLLVDCDVGRLEQIVVNLAVNSRDAMPEGGVLTLETALDGAEVRLAVRDTGIGMDAQTSRLIFEPFFTTKPPHQGTGLGLSIVHGLLHSLGGHLRLETAPGEGTTMHVLFPHSAAEAEPPAAPVAAGRQAARTPCRILVVEDERVVRVLAERILKQEGHVVETASTVGEALALFRDGFETPDLVLTDAVLPDGTGPQLARRLRESRPELPVLLMSGYLNVDVVNGGDWPVECFLAKPFSRTGLLDKVAEMVAARRP